MMKAAIGTGLVAGLLALGGAIPGARAADAAHPYSNVNHAVDAGNDTGDSQTDQLNEQQLQKNAPSGANGGAATPGGGSPAWRAGDPANGAPPGAARPYGYPYPPPYGYRAPYAYPPFYVRPWPWRRRRVWVGPRYPAAGVYVP